MTEQVSDEALAGRWMKAGLNVPRELVDETIRRGGRMAPHLGAMLTDADLWQASSEEPEFWAPIHAVFLVQAIKDPAFTPHVCRFLREGLGEYWLTEEGARLVFSLGPGALEPIWAVATDPEANDWGRIVAVDGIVMLGLAHESLRADLAARFLPQARLLSGGMEDDVDGGDEVVLNALLGGLACLHEEAAKALIEEAYSKEWADLCLAAKEDVLEPYQKSFEELLQERTADPLKHFDPERLAVLEAEGPPWEDEDFPRPFVNPASKAGRNDPCPCGSGKKHKKCCGKDQA